nr:immunoglobulin light chain junction region [Macaca mulatta]
CQQHSSWPQRTF